MMGSAVDHNWSLLWAKPTVPGHCLGHRWLYV